MKKTHTLILPLLLLLWSCSSRKPLVRAQHETFGRELAQLQELFHIPALSVIVKRGDRIVYENYSGMADLEKNIPNDATTTFPMASLTKVFAAVTLLRLQEEGRLDMEDPIARYLPGRKVPDSIKVKHVLSHTSQGQLGRNFYYSSRFSWLTGVIEKASGQPFDQAVGQRTIAPLQLKNTYFLRDSLQLRDRKIARPYNFEGSTIPGAIEYGYSAAAGLNATVRDLASFDDALDQGLLIGNASRERMYAPFQKGLPYGLGMFSQDFQGHRLQWAYGQYDSYGSLYLKVPEKKLTLLISANNNLMSDAARLIYGDAASSLFALSFLKNYVLDLQQMPLLEDSLSLAKASGSTQNNAPLFYRKKLLAQALTESFLAAHEPHREKRSAALLAKVFALYPDTDSYADLQLLHNLNFLNTIAMHHRRASFTEYDPILERTGKLLLKQDPDNPYAHYYLASYYADQGKLELARRHYAAITALKNHGRMWYTTEAQQWLKKNPEGKDK